VSLLVKVCGVTSEAALEAALEAGADALGFVLAPSPRRLTLARARELLARVPAPVERVAVFARATRAELEAARDLGFDVLQAELGSDFPPEDGRAFALPSLRDGPDLDLRLRALPRAQALGRSLRGALVLDGPLGGGRGLAVDPGRARAAARERALVLAGGLTPDNVAERIAEVRPAGVDASSGLERERGVKDVALVRAFVLAARAAARSLPEMESIR